MSERDMTRVGNEAHTPGATGPQLLNSKSVPTLHHIGKLLIPMNLTCLTQVTFNRQRRK